MAEIQESGGKGDGKVRVKKNSGKPDMTPMVDLGFLLITFFMYTTTFSKPNVMKLNMPVKDTTETVEPPPIKISNTITILMGKDDRIFWHQTPIDETFNESVLTETDYTSEGIRKAIYSKYANALDTTIFTVIIKPAEDANWKNTVDILDEMAITKMSRFAVVNPQPKEKEALEFRLQTPKKEN